MVSIKRGRAHLAESEEKAAELIPPYGGRLVDLTAGEEESAELLARARTLPSIQLSERAVCDLELLPLAMRLGGPREALWHAVWRARTFHEGSASAKQIAT